MVMKVRLEHVFVNGNHAVKIIGFKVLSKGRLPVEYTKCDKFPMCYTHTLNACADPVLFVNDANGSEVLRHRNYRVGTIINMEEKEWLLNTMRAAGNRLCRINKAADAERQKWEGKIEVVKF